jgi:tRNA-dihydrouridine synthase B
VPATASISDLRTPRIGPFQLRTPFVQAALSGYSDWPMRVLARRFGASYALCEVLLDQFVLQLKMRDRTKHHLKSPTMNIPSAASSWDHRPTNSARPH